MNHGRAWLHSTPFVPSTAIIEIMPGLAHLLACSPVKVPVSRSIVELFELDRVHLMLIMALLDEENST